MAFLSLLVNLLRTKSINPPFLSSLFSAKRDYLLLSTLSTDLDVLSVDGAGEGAGLGCSLDFILSAIAWIYLAATSSLKECSHSLTFAASNEEIVYRRAWSCEV